MLAERRDRLLEVGTKMQTLNHQNEDLLKQAMEMVEFDLTLLKSMRRRRRPLITIKTPIIQETCLAAADLTRSSR